MDNNYKKFFLIIVITGLLFVSVQTVAAQNILQDIFGPLFGEGTSILNIADFYVRYSSVIDFILITMIFISISLIALGQRFSGGAGKVIAIAVGLILSFALTWWMSQQNPPFTLKSFGPIAALVIISLVGVAVFAIITRLFEDKVLSAAMAYIFVFFGLLSVVPSVIDWIKGIKGLNILYPILYLLGIACLAIIVVKLVQLVIRAFGRRRAAPINVPPLPPPRVGGPAEIPPGARQREIAEEGRVGEEEQRLSAKEQQEKQIEEQAKQVSEQARRDNDEIMRDLRALREIIHTKLRPAPWYLFRNNLRNAVPSVQQALQKIRDEENREITEILKLKRYDAQVKDLENTKFKLLLDERERNAVVSKIALKTDPRSTDKSITTRIQMRLGEKVKEIQQTIGIMEKDMERILAIEAHETNFRTHMQNAITALQELTRLNFLTNWTAIASQKVNAAIAGIDAAIKDKEGVKSELSQVINDENKIQKMLNHELGSEAGLQNYIKRMIGATKKRKPTK